MLILRFWSRLALNKFVINSVHVYVLLTNTNTAADGTSPTVSRCVSYLQLVDHDSHPLWHGEEALKVGLIQEDVDHHASERGADDLLKYVNVSEDVHGDGDDLDRC